MGLESPGGHGDYGQRSSARIRDQVHRGEKLPNTDGNLPTRSTETTSDLRNEPCAAYRVSFRPNASLIQTVSVRFIFSSVQWVALSRLSRLLVRGTENASYLLQGRTSSFDQPTPAPFSTGGINLSRLIRFHIFQYQGASEMVEQ